VGEDYSFVPLAPTWERVRVRGRFHPHLVPQPGITINPVNTRIKNSKLFKGTLPVTRRHPSAGGELIQNSPLEGNAHRSIPPLRGDKGGCAIQYFHCHMVPQPGMTVYPIEPPSI